MGVCCSAPRKRIAQPAPAECVTRSRRGFPFSIGVLDNLLRKATMPSPLLDPRQANLYPLEAVDLRDQHFERIFGPRWNVPNARRPHVPSPQKEPRGTVKDELDLDARWRRAAVHKASYDPDRYRGARYRQGINVDISGRASGSAPGRRCKSDECYQRRGEEVHGGIVSKSVAGSPRPRCARKQGARKPGRGEYIPFWDIRIQDFQSVRHPSCTLKTIHLRAYKKFREGMAHARKAAGLSQTEMAAVLGKPQSFASKVENGDRRVDVVEFAVWMRAAEADPGALLAELVADLESSRFRRALKVSTQRQPTGRARKVNS